MSMICNKVQLLLRGVPHFAYGATFLGSMEPPTVDVLDGSWYSWFGNWLPLCRLHVWYEVDLGKSESKVMQA